MQQTEDTRVAYGARCTWWGDIKDVGTFGAFRIPCCPKCSGMLFEMDSEALFVAKAEEYERDSPAPGYVDMLMWAKGRCFKVFGEMVDAYSKFKAEEVK